MRIKLTANSYTFSLARACHYTKLMYLFSSLIKKDKELESLLASLKISKENEAQTFSKEARATNEEHLSPQSFAMVCILQESLHCSLASAILASMLLFRETP